MTGRGLELAKLLKERRVHIACVQELKWKGAKSRDLGEGYKLLYYGTTTTRNGVGVVLHETLRDRVLEVMRVSDRLMAVKLDLPEGALLVVSAYAPQSGCSGEVKDAFWESLDTFLQSVSPAMNILVGGDLNGHVGAAREGYETAHGGFGYGTRNDEGESILNAAVAYDLVVANTYFRKREEHLITYKSGRVSTQIDYILVRRAALREVTNCKVIPGDGVAPQHRLLVLDIRLRQPLQARKRTMVPNVKWWELNNKEKRHNFAGAVVPRLANTPSSDLDVNEMWQAAATTMCESARELLGTTKGGKRIHRETWWWNTEVQDAVRKKKAAFKIWQRSRQPTDREEYVSAKQAVKQAISAAKTARYQDLYDKLDTREGENAVYRLARARNAATKDIQQVTTIKDAKGEPLRKEREIQDRWGEYFHRLLNEENSRDPYSDMPPVSGPITTITRVEVEHALGKMKNGKAVGPDGIPAEAWKACGSVGVTWLTALFNKILENGKMPEAWRHSTIVPIYKKKGDVQQCGNYRGIKLMSHTMKLWERVIDGRLRAVSEVAHNQFGFVPGRSTTDAIFALRMIVEKHREKCQQLHLAFIDMEKAYDRVPRDLIWWALRKKQVPEQYVSIIQDMYHKAQAVVRTCHGDSAAFPVTVGVHQGSALSPYLFITVLDTICEDLLEPAPWTMLYADDVVLCSTSQSDLEEKLQKWKDRLHQYGLRLNITKTEYMAPGRETTDHSTIHLDSTPITRVEEFRYLGSVISEDGNIDADVKARMASGWLKWRECSGVLCDKKMPMQLRGKVYRSVVRPALLYGSECWAPLLRHEQAIHTTEMRMLRWTCGVTRLDKIPNTEIRRRMGVAPITEKAQEHRLRWYGHMERRPNDYIGKVVQRMEVEGTRPRGRPRRRWLEVIEDDMKACRVRPRDAQDREKWKCKTRKADPTR